ncbi:MAG TPA: hypothetical protein DHW61_01060 [Lachnoclostridium phytofermentans]|uniref:Uncharacterized protein n=1 Tax=Lachnoclostridium phytofermentans TaxID=66219 RepID=A0A3D2X1I8_9FIRM|nr:hypothetical protein [Lachnoclostridium sp.]HCL01010.1 hypothetical protein [Lachnoclostridium phytofermentans]
MKNIIKVNAILTNVTEGNNKKPNNRTLHKSPKTTQKWSYFSYHVGNKIVTSENSLTVNGTFQEGHHMTVWYVEKKPKKVYRYKVLAMIFG